MSRSNYTYCRSDKYYHGHEGRMKPFCCKTAPRPSSSLLIRLPRGSVHGYELVDEVFSFGLLVVGGSWDESELSCVTWHSSAKKAPLFSGLLLRSLYASQSIDV